MVRRPIISLYDGAGLKTKDTMRIFLATTPDNSTSNGVTIVLVHHLDEVEVAFLILRTEKP